MKTSMRRSVWFVLILLLVFLLTGCKGKLDEEQYAGKKLGVIINLDENVKFDSMYNRYIIESTGDSSGEAEAFSRKYNPPERIYLLSQYNAENIKREIKKYIMVNTDLEVTFIDGNFNDLEKFDDYTLETLQSRYNIDLLLTMDFRNLKYKYESEHDINLEDDIEDDFYIDSELDEDINKDEMIRDFHSSEIELNFILYELPGTVISQNYVDGDDELEEIEYVDSQVDDISLQSPVSFREDIIIFNSKGEDIIIDSIKDAIFSSMVI